MGLTIDMTLFGIGVLIGFWYYYISVYLIIYGVPRSLFGYFKNELSLNAALVFLRRFIFWHLAIIVFFTLIAVFFPKIFTFLRENSGFTIGLVLGFWVSATRPTYSSAARKEMSVDFQTDTAECKINESQG